jgi:hypothetical protein
MPELRTTGKVVPVSLSDKNFLAASYGGTRQFIEIKEWIDAIAMLLRATRHYSGRSPCIASAPSILRAEQPWLLFLHAQYPCRSIGIAPAPYPALSGN